VPLLMADAGWYANPKKISGLAPLVYEGPVPERLAPAKPSG